MIIRRISQGIKDQDWFVVAVEVMIVVVGIFIGLQVDDWNEARKDKAQEQNLLSEIAQEIERAKKSLSEYKTLLEGWNVQGADFIENLDNPQTCEAPHEEILSQIYSVTGFPPFNFSFVALEEMIQSGTLNLINNQAIRTGARELQFEMKFLEDQWKRYIGASEVPGWLIFKTIGFTVANKDLLGIEARNVDQNTLKGFAFRDLDKLCGNSELVAAFTSIFADRLYYTSYLDNFSEVLEKYNLEVVSFEK